MEKRIKCTECEGHYAKRKVHYDYAGYRIGTYPALVCDKCGDTMFESDACDAMEKELKRRKLWGLRSKGEKILIEQARHS